MVKHRITHIPAEVRLLVYRHMFRSTPYSLNDLNKDHAKFEQRYQKDFADLKHLLNLRLINKQTNLEISALVEREATVYIWRIFGDSTPRLSNGSHLARLDNVICLAMGIIEFEPVQQQIQDEFSGGRRLRTLSVGAASFVSGIGNRDRLITFLYFGLQYAQKLSFTIAPYGRTVDDNCSGAVLVGDAATVCVVTIKEGRRFVTIEGLTKGYTDVVKDQLMTLNMFQAGSEFVVVTVVPRGGSRRVFVKE